MSAAHDIHANQPQPFTGRAVPPDRIQADNDDAVIQARARRQEAMKVKPRGKGRQKRLARLTGMNGPERALHKAHEAQKHRNKATILANVDPKGNKAKIAQHVAAARRLEEEAKAIMAEHSESQWVTDANRETVELARARGETAKQDIHGRVVVTSRCGLSMAYEAGKLEPQARTFTTEELFTIGRRYRDAYEIAMGLTSSKGSGGSAIKGPQLRKLEAGEDLKMLRTGLTAQRQRALDTICGESHTVETYAKANRLGLNEAKDQLVEGLQDAAFNARAAKAAKDTRARITPEGLARAADAIARAERSVA